MKFDQLNELSDPLICHILSYLLFTDAVKTSVLSKRWKFLWLDASVFDLTTVKSSLLGNALISLMNKFMTLNRSSCLQNLKIKYGDSCYPRKESDIISFEGCFNYGQEIKKTKYYHTIDCNRRVLLLIAELVRHGIQHLDVDMCPNAKDIMPKKLYVSKTLVSLKLANVRLEDPKFVVSLPSLKTMHLKSITYVTDFGGFLVMKQFIAASPMLEDLTFDMSDLRNPLYFFLTKGFV